MISLEYHHFELNIIERNPQDGGSLMMCALMMVRFGRVIKNLCAPSPAEYGQALVKLTVSP